jgi:hypothetical protein
VNSFNKIRSALLVALVACLPFAASASDSSTTWDFSVLLDGDEIGYHRFQLVEDGATRRITSEAKFDVRFLFVNAFRYRHSNTEVWSNGCLRELEARTQANGKKLAVKGYEAQDKFVVDDGEVENVFADCVMTFAYWNPEFLRQERLLNPQSGEYLDVDVQELGTEPITVRGREVNASVYKLTAKKLELTLWYSADNEWLALESVAKGGRKIRYELI